MRKGLNTDSLLVQRLLYNHLNVDAVLERSQAATDAFMLASRSSG